MIVNKVKDLARSIETFGYILTTMEDWLVLHKQFTVCLFAFGEMHLRTNLGNTQGRVGLEPSPKHPPLGWPPIPTETPTLSHKEGDNSIPGTAWAAKCSESHGSTWNQERQADKVALRCGMSSTWSTAEHLIWWLTSCHYDVTHLSVVALVLFLNQDIQ